MFHGQNTPSPEPRGELSSFYDEHSRVVRVHDPVRTFFDTSDSMPAVDNSFSDHARALSVFRVSRILYNRVVIPAAHARKCLDPGESWTCAPATEMIGRRVSDNFDVRKVEARLGEIGPGARSDPGQEARLGAQGVTDPADLGPASSLQLLDEPGVAENGDLQPWRWPEPATGEQTQLPHA